MENTHKHDMDFIEQKRDELSEEQKEGASAILEQIYAMSKDDYMEKMRKELIKWMIVLSKDPNNLEALSKFNDIRRKLEAYGRSPEFIQRMQKVTKKISEEQARFHLARTLKGA